VAVLQVGKDPFATWDDLAAQAQRLGVPMPRSGTCQWWFGPDSDRVAVTEPTPAAINALDCEASETGLTDGGPLRVSARLYWWSGGAELTIQTSTSTGTASDAEPDPGSAPADAIDALPTRRSADHPEVGEPFGLGHNCFEGADGRFRVPKGSRLVGGGTAPGLEDFAAVLAVTDARKVLGALGRQVDPTGPGRGRGAVSIGPRDLADVGRIWVLEGSIGAGGGFCEMWSSPDGEAVIVTTHSD
jgi:hypothetical protein